MLPRGVRRRWQNVGSPSGNRVAQGRTTPPEKKVSPNTPASHSPPSPNMHPSPPPSPSPSPSPINDRMLTGGSMPTPPLSNIMPGAPHRQNQGINMSPVAPLRLTQMANQVDVREGRVRVPNRLFANNQAQQPNVRNFARPSTAARRVVRNRQRQLARNNNINLTPPEHLGK